MKSIRCIQVLTICIIVTLISCSAITKKTQSPMERLKNAVAKGQDFRSVGETFEGDLSIEDLVANRTSFSSYINSELIFEGCTFMGNIIIKPVDSKSLYFEKEVIFEGCEFAQEVTINDATFSKRLQIGGNLYRRSLDLQRNTYLNTCRIDENEVGQDLILQYSRCHENLSAFGNSLGRHLSMQGISIQGKTQLSNTTLHGSIDISNSHFHEDFTMDYAKQGQKLLAGNSKFMSSFRIRDLDEFQSVDLSSSQVFGKYMLTTKNELEPNLKNTFFTLQ